ncbi:DUF3431 domain-containing protein [Flavobacteriaceae bacterium]|nr:DUF3431 domain-containing protein [Flavobacteriaceae bacterium]
MTDTFFLISNYNTDPSYLLKYCEDYIIYDQSDKSFFDIGKTKLKFVKSQHTGHNISDYFQFFIDNYDNLPDQIALLKGNIIGRHISLEYFERVYQNKYFTYLYNDINIATNGKSYFLLTESKFVELNNSWYARYHPSRYFSNYNDLLKFIYKKPVISKYNLFSPGACYILSKKQITNNSKEFYINLLSILNYTLDPKFPSEAHQIERMLPIIFSSSYEKNSYMDSIIEFNHELSKTKPRKLKFSITQYIKNALR